MTVSDNTIQEEGLSSFFNLGRGSAKAGKNLATNVLQKPGRALEITSNIANAAATRNSKNSNINTAGDDNFLSYGKSDLPWVISLILCHLIVTKNSETIPISTTRNQRFGNNIRKKIE